MTGAWLIGLVMLAPTAGQTGTPGAAIPSVAPVDPVAARIADWLASDEIVLGQTRQMLRDQLPQALAADPAVQEMETDRPGITREMIAVMEPIIIASLSRQLPAYRRDVATIFSRRMTPEELTAANAFYASPTGQRLITLMRDGADFSALLRRQIATSGEVAVSGADIKAAIMPAVQPAISNLSSEDQLRLISFGMSAAGRKMNAINPELLEVAARFNNIQDPQTDAELEKAIAGLIARRTAPASRKRAR